MHLAVGNQWGLIGMPMAQVKTIKKEEKCLTTPQPCPTPMLTQRPRRDGGSGGKREEERAEAIQGMLRMSRGGSQRCLDVLVDQQN